MQDVSELRTGWSTADEIVIFVSRRAFISKSNPCTGTSDIMKAVLGGKLAFKFPGRPGTCFQFLFYDTPFTAKYPVFILPLASRNR